MVRMMGWLIVYFKEDEPRRKVSGMYFFESDMEVPALTEEMYGGIIEHHGEPADETAKMYFYEMQESK